MTHQEKLDEAQALYLFWYDKGYTAKNRGDNKTAAHFFTRGNFWLDRFNKLAGE